MALIGLLIHFGGREVPTTDRALTRCHGHAPAFFGRSAPFRYRNRRPCSPFSSELARSVLDAAPTRDHHR